MYIATDLHKFGEKRGKIAHSLIHGGEDPKDMKLIEDRVKWHADINYIESIA